MSDLDEFLALVGTKCEAFVTCKRDWMGVDKMHCPFVITGDSDFHSSSKCPTVGCNRQLTVCDCGEGNKIWEQRICMERPDHQCPKLEQAED